MDFNEYQQAICSMGFYPEARTGSQAAIIYTVMGLVGEAGEVAEKAKKWMRDGTWDDQEVLKELGDVLWYIGMCAYEMGFNFDAVATGNLSKLRDRQDRGVASGSGDNR